MPGATQPTPTDFVQDYAAKRQAQMERARKMREDRLQQQQLNASKPSLTNLKRDPAVKESGNSHTAEGDSRTENTANGGRDHSLSQKHPVESSATGAANHSARSHHILHVVEEDFTRATQAGIITPDQARQLWAMFSNQVIRVGGVPVDAVVALHSLKLLSQRSSSNSSGHTHGSGDGAAGGGFGGSITMESLRQSIAQFKEDQAHHRQQTREDNEEEHHVRHTHHYTNHSNNNQEDSRSSRRRNMHLGDDEQDAFPSRNSHGSNHLYSEYDSAVAGDNSNAYANIHTHNHTIRAGGKKKTTGGGRPAWNFDTTAAYHDDDEETHTQPSDEVYARDTRTSKSNKSTNSPHTHTSMSGNSQRPRGTNSGVTSQADTHAVSASSQLPTRSTTHSSSVAPASTLYDSALSSRHDRSRLTEVDDWSTEDRRPAPTTATHAAGGSARGPAASKPLHTRAAKRAITQAAKAQDVGPARTAQTPPTPQGLDSGAAGAPRRFDDVPVAAARSGVEQQWRHAYPSNEEANEEAEANSRYGDAGVLRAAAKPIESGWVLDTNRAIEQEAKLADQEPTQACSSCGRTFRESVLARHEQVCRKQSSKPRKQFDMRRQRWEGVEGGGGAALAMGRGGGALGKTVRKRKTGMEGAAAGATMASSAAAPATKLPKWKVQHEQFQAAMRAAHQQTRLEHQSAAGGGFGSGQLPAPPAPLPEEYDTRVPCPHCGRKFAEETAQRHIPKCATTIAKPKGLRPRR